MRLPGLARNASFITFAVSLLLISSVAAQGLPKLSDELGAAATTDGKGAAKTDAAKTDTAAATDAKKTDAAKTTDAAAKTAAKTATMTNAAAKTTDPAALSGLPKLDEDKYPAPTVPPTAGAPFMQKSNLPEGTVFICVGAALGFIGMMVLAWRGFMAWSLHRSVRKAAIASTAKYAGRDPLSGLKKSKGPYMHSGPGSTLSLDQLGGGRKNAGGKTHSTHSNLFFSPTAGAGMNAPSNRASGYLPSGYYASGNAAPASGAGMTHIGSGVPMSNLSNQNRYSQAGLGPRGHSPSRSRAPSPPSSRGGDSLFNGSRLSTPGLMGQASSSTLNLNAAPQGRAPSAYLDDLFENHAPVQTPTDDKRHSRRQ
ncbi:MAG: hypothetical protein OHK93_005109 [Ramalina farinacea]|uniref:CSI2 protein n=1 Tax=Ramalina farinacea TaxID=258253 RepID=A0AA43TVQ2_9LECA|nr:hypothetical protein [Ramalina farinacea]